MNNSNTAPAFLLRIVPPLWVLIFLVSGWGIGYLVPAAQVFHFSIPAAGGVLLGAGLLFVLLAGKLFGEEGTEFRPTSPSNRALVTRGVYRVTRNPMYLGMVLLLGGVAFCVGTLPMFLAPLGQFLVMNFAVIPFEEEKMGRQFGERYESYRRKVRRWL